MKKLRRGFTIVQLLVVLFLSALAFVLIGELLKNVNVVSERGKQGAALASLQDMLAPLRTNVGVWLQRMRAGSPGPDWFNACLPSAAGATSVCPSAANISAYPPLQAKASGRYVVESDVLDLQGRPLAGKSSTPVRYDETGSPCSSADCRFFAYGFAILNSSTNPGDVTFAVVLVQNPNLTKQAGVWAPRISYFEIGKFWQTALANSCPAGQYVTGLDANQQVMCAFPGVPKLRKILEQTFYFSNTSGVNFYNDSSYPNAITLCALSATDDDTSVFADSDPPSSKKIVGGGGYKCEVRKSGTQWIGIAPMPGGSVGCAATCSVFEVIP